MLYKKDFNSISLTHDLKQFYSELLHILGLEETKVDGRGLLQRKSKGERNPASLVENTIAQLERLDKIPFVEKISQYGENGEEQLHRVALELVITWANRILLLKLLEAQLISNNKGNKSFVFLNATKIRSFEALNSLFFNVFARNPNERNELGKDLFSRVPYLENGLFEPSVLEQRTIFISDLKSGPNLSIYSSTVLKDSNGEYKDGLDVLFYLLEFLDAYNIGGKASEETQENNKVLIDSSLVGSLFEKMNGTQRESLPSSRLSSMNSCGEAIQIAVLEKLNESSFRSSTFNKSKPGSGNYQDRRKFASITEVYNSIGKDLTKQEAIKAINRLKIVDRSVGGGDTVISVLQEIIIIKNELKLLIDIIGRPLENIDIKVVNGELVITDEKRQLFEYNSQASESHRIQEVLFYEKKRIIENCLFGADENPQLVNICCFRLWLELLKHSYAKQAETNELTSPVCYANSPELRDDFKDDQQPGSSAKLVFNIKARNIDDQVMEEGCVYIS